MVPSTNQDCQVSRGNAENDLSRWIKNVLCPELGNWKLIKLVSVNGETGSVEIVSLWEENDCEAQLLRMDIALFHTEQLAAEQLYRQPNNMVHPVFAENGGPLSALGDARLVSCSETMGAPARAWFTRGNVMVAVMGGPPEMDITGIANTVDRLLQRESGHPWTLRQSQAND